MNAVQLARKKTAPRPMETLVFVIAWWALVALGAFALTSPGTADTAKKTVKSAF